MPLLLLLVFGIIDFGRAYQAKVELAHAAREGVRVWALTQDAAEADVRTKQAAPSLELASTAASEVTTTTSGCTFGQPTTLTAAYEFSYITPLSALMAAMPGGSALRSPITLTETGVMRCSG
jgi:Flp pilus assembly protein TadG